MLKAEAIARCYPTNAVNKPDYNRIYMASSRLHAPPMPRLAERSEYDHNLSYADAVAKTDSETIKTRCADRGYIVRGICGTYGGGASAAGDDQGAGWG